MAYLTDAQRNLLAPLHGDHPEDGYQVPTSDQPPFVDAACWAWALNGQYMSPNGAYSAPTIYGLDGAYTFAFDEDGNESITGLNANFFNNALLVAPAIQPFYDTLQANIDGAIAGEQDAQDACRLALMKVAATLNGHTVLPDDGSAVYTIAMAAEVWSSWVHWGIGVQGVDAAVTTLQQKVPEEPLMYDCGILWDSDTLPLTTVIRVDGLLQAQVDMLNRVV